MGRCRLKFRALKTSQTLRSKSHPLTIVRASHSYLSPKSRSLRAELRSLGRRVISPGYAKHLPGSHVSSTSVGKRVTLSVRRLRAQHLPDNAKTSSVRVTVDGTLAGNAFTCRWAWEGKTICLVTQLVVGKEYRHRGLAKGLLGALREDVDDLYRIMSSHPAACLAAGSTFASSIEKVSLDFMAKNASSIMKASPIPYVQDAKLCGSLFGATDFTALVSGANTNFFVDHQEPMEALRAAREIWN